MSARRPQRGPRFCRKLTRTCLGRGRACAAREEREAVFHFGQKVIFTSQRHKRVQDTTTSSSRQMLLISGFHLGQPTDDDFYCLRPIFIWGGLSLFSQLEQPVAVTSSCFLRMFSPFSRLFFSFSDDVTLVEHLPRVSPMSPVSGYPAALQRCWLCFSRMVLVPGLTAPRLAGDFSLSISADIFCSVLFPF